MKTKIFQNIIKMVEKSEEASSITKLLADAVEKVIDEMQRTSFCFSPELLLEELKTKLSEIKL